MNHRMNYSLYVRAALCIAVAALLPSLVYAQALTCSYDPMYYIPFPPAGTGIISQVVANISNIVNNLAVGMYAGLVANITFQGAAVAVITLYILIYGVMFMGGMTQISLHDAVIRLVKIGLVVTLIGPFSWNFFYNYMGAAFDTGKNELIGDVLSVGVGGAAGWTVMDPNTGTAYQLDPSVLARYPFVVLDNAVAVLTSSKMAITLLATFTTGPYGIVIGLLILMGLGSYAGALFQAMWVYLMSVVVTAFLFAVAPIFFIFLLFQRTRNLFDGWVNQLVSATLQPLFLFTFFSFFSAMMWSAITRLLYTPVCWMPPGDVWRGSPFNIYMWRFMIPGQNGWQMYNGAMSYTGPNVASINAPTFPISIGDVLALVLIAQLAKRFNDVVLHIAREIAGASLQLDISSRIGNFFSPNRMMNPIMQAMQNKAPARPGAGAAASFMDRLRKPTSRPGAGGKDGDKDE